MKYTKPLIRITLSVIILGLFGWFIASNWDDFSSLSIEQPWMLIGAALAVAVSLYSAGMVNELTMEPHGIKPTRKEVYALAAGTRFLNQIATNYVGASMRAVYFKKVYGVSYTKFSSSFAVANVLQILISLAIATGLFFFIKSENVEFSSILGVVSAGAMIAVLLFLPVGFIQHIIIMLQKHTKTRLLSYAYNLLNEYSRVRSHPGLFQRMVVWMATLSAISGVIIYLLYASLGVQISLVEAVFIAGIANLSIILSITPAGLGIREGMIVFGSAIVGLPAVTALAVSLLLRFVVAITAGSVSLLLIRTLTHHRE